MDKAENVDKAENKIKILRDYLGLSQAAFAKSLDLSPTHIVIIPGLRPTLAAVQRSLTALQPI